MLAEPSDALATEKAKREAGRTPTKVVDPVCKMIIEPDTAVATSVFRGATHSTSAQRTVRSNSMLNPQRFSSLQEPYGEAGPQVDAMTSSCTHG